MALYLSGDLTAAQASAAIGIDARAIERAAPAWFFWDAANERRVARLVSKALAKARKRACGTTRK